ncbi:MAG: hypothetical protein ACHBN1_11090 [Heteroscytonema crispum UTEX LB 1556]
MTREGGEGEKGGQGRRVWEAKIFIFCWGCNTNFEFWVFDFGWSTLTVPVFQNSPNNTIYPNVV